MLGFGLSSIGVFGFGFSSLSYEQPVKVKTVGTKKFNPLTRDYVFADNGGYVGTNQVRQRVILSLLTRKGSSTVLREFGNEVLNMRYRVQNIEPVVKNYVELALQTLTDSGQITINSVSSNFEKRNTITIFVEYLNNTTNELEDTNFTLNLEQG